MSVEITTILKVATFVTSIMSENKTCYKIALSEMNAADNVLKNINYECDRKAAINRILVHLESAYSLISSKLDKRMNIILCSEDYEVQNKLCYSIALFHKELGNDHSIIVDWMLNKTTIKGSCYFETVENFQHLLGDSYEEFYINIYNGHSKYIDDRNAGADTWDPHIL